MHVAFLQWRRTKVYLNIAVLNDVHGRVIKFDPFAFALYQRVVVTEGFPTADMDHNTFNLVGLSTLETIDPQFRWVGYPVYQLLVLVSLLIKFKSFQVRDQKFGTALNLNLFGPDLLGVALFALELVRLVE